ncbi:MAG: hypothetical protein E3J71_07650 [Candidatus Stahlbacteria bacterium]|nr:MAG: hypothetical protein E3J71_07650 [Candidatus Stahlbacteria bacterium]
MNKTIVSLALLKCNWDRFRKDHLENFMPFLATLINKKAYNVIDSAEICKDFEAEYGLRIPQFAMVSILNRARKRELIRKEERQFIPEPEKVKELDFSIAANTQRRQQEKVLKAFVSFAWKKYSMKKTVEDASRILLSFLKNRDSKILSATCEESALPTVTSVKTEKYLMYSFIEAIRNSEPKLFKYIVDIAIGHVLASALLYREFKKYEGKLKGLNLYLDTTMVIRLLGYEGKEIQEAYLELAEIIASEGAKFFVFEHTYDEIRAALTEDLQRIQSRNINLAKAKPSLKFFVQNGYKPSDIESIIVNLRSVFLQHKIRIAPMPDLDRFHAYQINEEELRSIIVKIYTDRNPNFNQEESRNTINRDIDSIGHIYKLRRGHKTGNINDVGSLFVTSNVSLALASSVFDETITGDSSHIPPCLNDVFVGTLVWLRTPAKVYSVNEKRLIAECCAALQPSDELIDMFNKEVKKLKRAGTITDNDYYALRTHRVAMNLLAEKTMGDPRNFTQKTAEEVLQEIKKEEYEKYLIEAKEHQRTKEEKKGIGDNVKMRADQIAKVITEIIVALSFIAFGASTVLQFFPNIITWTWLLRCVFALTSLLLGGFSISAQFNILGLGEKLKGGISNDIVKFFMGSKQTS